MWNTGYTASPNAAKYAWFKAGLLDRIFSPDRGVEQLCRVTAERIREIDDFLRGGEPSPFFSEKLSWGSPIAAAIGRRPPMRRLNR